MGLKAGFQEDNTNLMDWPISQQALMMEENRLLLKREEKIVAHFLERWCCPDG